MLARCRTQRALSAQAKEQGSVEQEEEDADSACARHAAGASRPYEASTRDAMSACGLTNASTPQGRRLLDRTVASLATEFVLIGLRERWAETLELLGAFTGCQWVSQWGGGKGLMDPSHHAESPAAGEGSEEAALKEVALRATDGRPPLDAHAIERELTGCEAELLARGGALEQDRELHAAAVEVFKRQLTSARGPVK